MFKRGDLIKADHMIGDMPEPTAFNAAMVLWNIEDFDGEDEPGVSVFPIVDKPNPIVESVKLDSRTKQQGYILPLPNPFPLSRINAVKMEECPADLVDRAVTLLAKMMGFLDDCDDDCDNEFDDEEAED